MPWKQETVMDKKREFVEMAKKEEMPFTALCERFGIAPKTGYKYLRRWKEEGEKGLEERSRRPLSSPKKTDTAIEALLLETREERQTWGARKLRARLLAIGHQNLPANSTCHAILKRHPGVALEDGAKHRARIRFEHPAPNCLWQMDHKGDFACAGRRCFPLVVIDDHSRFNILLEAHDNQRLPTVQAALIAAFRLYGLPEAMTMDNGNPWGDSNGGHMTRCDLWLMRLGVRATHSRPGHPQTQGKNERFNRTLGLELLSRNDFHTHALAQQAMDDWRHIYNHERPHEALGMQAPVSRYSLSPRPYPEYLPPLEYASDVVVRRVHHNLFWFKDLKWAIGGAFDGQDIGLRPTTQDGLFDILYGPFVVAHLCLVTNTLTRERRRFHIE